MTGSAAGEAGSPFDAALATLFAARGAATLAVPILQPADPYLDTAGEALRRRIFLTRGEGGEDLCLRPDFTIPVCLAHIAEGAGLPRRYAYNGLVFRQGRSGAAEFRQAGIEDLGDADPAAADARALADALACLETCGLEPGRLHAVLGDQALFEAFLRQLGLPGGWQRRLVRAFGHDDLLDASLCSLARADAAAFDDLPPRLLDLARSGDAAGLGDAVAAMMEAGGLPPKRGRSAAEIAERLIERVTVAEARLSEVFLGRLRRFLAVDCPLGEAGTRLRALCAEGDIDLGPALGFFEARAEALAAAGVDLAEIRYRAAFGRPIDYYTGMVFEVFEAAGSEPLAGGGRYDRLVSYLGAPAPIPAVGFSLWLARIKAAAGGRP